MFDVVKGLFTCVGIPVAHKRIKMDNKYYRVRNEDMGLDLDTATMIIAEMLKLVKEREHQAS